MGAPYDGLLLYGSAYLLLGSAAGVPSGPLADHTKFTNEFDYDFTGLSVAGAGDVNNDGFDDILIGAPHYSTGRTYLLLGAAEGIGSMDLADADAIFTGDFADGSAGDQVAGAGDVNGDGFDDIVIGASFAAPNGMAYVVHGSADPADLSLENADTVLTGEFGMTGDAASGAGDIDGDGFADVLIGAYGHWQERGAAYLLLGSAGGIASDSLANADTVFTEAADGNNAGRSVSGAGDVNGDGYADTLVGSSADGGNRQGAAYINLGSAAGIPSLNLANSDTAITGVYTEDLAGDRVSEAGDLDGDGFDDIMVVQFSSMNQLFYTFDIDNAFIFYGAAIGIPSSTTAAADAVLAGEPISDVAAAGDVNGDGQPDLLIGAQHSDPYGAAFLLLGGAL